VGGGEPNTSGCLPTSSIDTTTTQVGGEGVSSRAAIIAISVTSPIALLIIILLGVFFIRRERRKLVKLKHPEENGETNLNEPHPVFGPPVPPKPVQPPVGVSSSPVPVDPVYPAELFMTKSIGPRGPQSSRSTILAPIPTSSLRSAKSLSSITRSVSSRTKRSFHASHLRPLEDLDIAGLLELASQQPAATEMPRGYPASSPHTVTPVATPTVPPSPSVSAHSMGNSPISPARSQPGPDVPLSPLRWPSQESPNPSEQPPRPALPAAKTVAASRNGLLSKRIKPLPTPTPLQGAGLLEPSQSPTRF